MGGGPVGDHAPNATCIYVPGDDHAHLRVRCQLREEPSLGVGDSVTVTGDDAGKLLERKRWLTAIDRRATKLNASGYDGALKHGLRNLFRSAMLKLDLYPKLSVEDVAEETARDA